MSDNTEVTELRECPVCGGGGAGLLERWSTPPWKIMACPACRVVFLGNPPPPELLKTDLDWDILKDEERARRRAKMGKAYYFFSDGIKRFRAFIRSFASKKEHRYIMRFSEGPRILDVGCGGGHILAGLPEGMIPYGIEPSPGMHRDADELFRARGGFCVHNISHLGLAELPDDIRFDLVLMRSFLEHDVMAEETLRTCLTKLAPDGKVLIKVPNFGCWNSKLRGSNWPGIRNPDHVNYFTPKTLSRFVLKCGYSRCHIPAVWRLPTSDNLWALAYR